MEHYYLQSLRGPSAKVPSPTLLITKDNIEDLDAARVHRTQGHADQVRQALCTLRPRLPGPDELPTKPAALEAVCAHHLSVKSMGRPVGLALHGLDNKECAAAAACRCTFAYALCHDSLECSPPDLHQMARQLEQ